MTRKLYTDVGLEAGEGAFLAYRMAVANAVSDAAIEGRVTEDDLDHIMAQVSKDFAALMTGNTLNEGTPVAMAFDSSNSFFHGIANEAADDLLEISELMENEGASNVTAD